MFGISQIHVQTVVQCHKSNYLIFCNIKKESVICWFSNFEMRGSILMIKIAIIYKLNATYVLDKLYLFPPKVSF